MELTAPFLKKIQELDRSDKTALKRAAGVPMANADAKTLAAFYRCLPNGIPWRQEEKWFLVACLQCMWNAPDEETEPEPVEVVIARMRASDDLSSSTLHNIEVLLDTPWDSDGFALAKLVNLLKLIRQKSNRTPIDFAALLEDLIYWNAESQSIQKKWLRTIYVGAYANKTEV